MQKIDSSQDDILLSSDELMFYCKSESLKDICKYEYVTDSLKEWTERQFKETNGIVFIGATGIAVRSIAPFVQNKLSDGMVLVIDDMGKYVIPLLSGHVGGANDMADRLAKLINGVPVITTATDIHDRFAIDIFAKQNGLDIQNKAGIAKVSSKILDNKEIVIAVDSFKNVDMDSYEKCKYKNQIMIVEATDNNIDVYIGNKNIDNVSLKLIPKEYVLGIGCKKGKNLSEIEHAIQNVLAQANLDNKNIWKIASIDLKKEEQGIIDYANKYRLPFITFDADSLNSVIGDFNESDFVKSQVGVGNVCERAAMLLAGTDAEMVVHKTADNGVTVAIAKRKWRIAFNEE